MNFPLDSGGMELVHLLKYCIKYNFDTLLFDMLIKKQS